MEKSKEEEVKKATFKTLKLVTLPSTEMKSNLNQIKNQSRRDWPHFWMESYEAINGQNEDIWKLTVQSQEV